MRQDVVKRGVVSKQIAKRFELYDGLTYGFYLSEVSISEFGHCRRGLGCVPRRVYAYGRLLMCCTQEKL